MKAAILEDLDWHEDAVSTIVALAHAHRTITADDVRREMRTPPHPNHLGAAFTAARQLGYIEADGYTTSTSPSRHHGVLRTWRRKTEGVQK